MHQTIPGLPADVLAKVSSAVLFGDTQNGATAGKINGLAIDKCMGFCNPDDPLCSAGGFSNTGKEGGHLNYDSSIGDATGFLTSHL